MGKNLLIKGLFMAWGGSGPNFFQIQKVHPAGQLFSRVLSLKALWRHCLRWTYSAIFEQLWLEFLCELRRLLTIYWSWGIQTIIVSFLFIDFGVTNTRVPNVLGPPNQTKKLTHLVDLLGPFGSVLVSWSYCIKFSSLNPPPPLWI